MNIAAVFVVSSTTRILNEFSTISFEAMVFAILSYCRRSGRQGWEMYSSTICSLFDYSDHVHEWSFVYPTTGRYTVASRRSFTPRLFRTCAGVVVRPVTDVRNMFASRHSPSDERSQYIRYHHSSTGRIFSVHLCEWQRELFGCLLIVVHGVTLPIMLALCAAE